MATGSVPDPGPAGNGGRETITPASPGRPCPVCGGGHKCGAGDGGLLLCGRRAGPVPGFRHLGPSKGDPQFHLFRAESGRGGAGQGRAGRARDWPALARQFARNLTPEARDELAGRLRLPAAALDALPDLGVEGVGTAGRTFTFPECDGSGAVVGIGRRFPDGAKKHLPGGRRGLTRPAGWADRPGPVYLPEGPSDTLALTAAGLAAVGRPSNTGGVGHLAALLAGLDPAREVVVLGENDRKPGGQWPGRDGAERTAASLARTLGRPVRWALPPAGAKDARDWLTHPDRGDTPWSDRGRALAAELAAVAASPPAHGPTYPPPAEGEAWNDPHRLARLFAAANRDPTGEPKLVQWRDQYHRWDGAAWRPVPDSDLDA